MACLQTTHETNTRRNTHAPVSCLARRGNVFDEGRQRSLGSEACNLVDQHSGGVASVPWCVLPKIRVLHDQTRFGESTDWK